MKYSWKYNGVIIAICLVFTAFAVVSCGTDEPDNSWENEEWNENENGNTPSSSDDPEQLKAEIRRSIPNHVKVEASYGEYLWKFHIESNLHKAFPNLQLEFGIGHGDVDGNESVSIEKDAYDFKDAMKGGTRIMDFVNPFWYYYVVGIPETDYDIWAKAVMYYDSYLALKAKPTLTEEEQDLMRKLKKYLGEYEEPTFYSYTPSVYVLVDDKFFIKIATYRRK